MDFTSDKCKKKKEMKKKKELRIEDNPSDHDGYTEYDDDARLMFSARSMNTGRSNFTFKSEFVTEGSDSTCLPAIQKAFKNFINLALFDIMFCLFIISQEVADQSNLSLIILDAQYTKKSRVQAAIVS